MNITRNEAPLPVPAAPAAPAPAAAPPAAPPTTARESPFAKVLAHLGNAAAQGEQQVSHALTASKAGEALSPAELLSLQAGVYRYGEVIDLASRLVDRAQTGVKTVLQGQ